MNADGNFPSYEKQQEALTLLQELGVDVDTLIARLGTQTSAASNATSGNAHAKLNWLLTTLATVNTNTAAIKTTTTDTKSELAVVDALIDDLIIRMGVQASTPSNAVNGGVHAKLNYILANLGTIKSIQRGSASTGSSGSSVTITISPVDMTKSMLLLNGSANGTASVSGKLATNTSVIISGGTYLSADWQVVEFY